MRRLHALFLAALTCSGCSPARAPKRPDVPAPVEEVEGPKVHAATATKRLLDAAFELPWRVRERLKLKGPTRPEVTDEHRFAYADIPLLESAPLTKSDRESFWLVVVDKTSKDCAPGEPRPRFTWRFSRDWSAANTVVRIDDILLPPLGTLDGEREMDGLYAKLIADPYDPASNKKHISLVSSAEWWFLDRAHLTLDEAPITQYSGSFSDMAGRAKSAITGVARALVPGRIYAFRDCVAHCDEPLDSDRRVEELSLIGPPGLWVGSSGAVTKPQTEVEPFTVLHAPVVSGASATVLIDLSSRSAALVGEWPSHESEANTFELDVVWPNHEEPEVTLFSGRTTANPEQLHEARRPPPAAEGPCY